LKETPAIEFQNEFAGFPENLTAVGRYFQENLRSVKPPKYEHILQPVGGWNWKIGTDK